MRIGICSITAAELWGILEGLSLAWDHGFRKVHLETDSRCALSLLQKHTAGLHRHTHLVNTIQELLHRDWTVQITHIYMEANCIADFMANLANVMSVGCHRFQAPPQEAHHLLELDRFGVGRNRHVPL